MGSAWRARFNPRSLLVWNETDEGGWTNSNGLVGAGYCVADTGVTCLGLQRPILEEVARDHLHPLPPETYFQVTWVVTQADCIRYSGRDVVQPMQLEVINNGNNYIGPKSWE